MEKGSIVNKKNFYKCINLIILLVGMILALVGYYTNPTKQVGDSVIINIDLKNLLMNIGCSIIASAIIAFLTQKYLERKDFVYDMIEKWQLDCIYNTREEANTLSIDKNMKKLNSKLDIIAFGLDHFRNSKGKILEEKLKKKNNIQVRIITLNPNSMFVEQREKDEDKTQGAIQKSIKDLIKWADKVNKSCKRDAILIKYYDSLPLDSYLRIDNTVYVGPYEYGKMSSQSITFEFTVGGNGFGYYNNYFEDLWNNTELCLDNVSCFGEKILQCEYPANKNICAKICSDGIADYFTSYTDINNAEVKEYIRKAKSVKFIEIYSARNVKENFNALKEMIVDNDGKLTVLLFDASNSNSDAYKYLSNKFAVGNSIDGQASEVNIDNSELLNELKRLQESVGDKEGIELYYSDYIPQYSAIIIDNIAYLVLYQTSPGRNTDIPAFKIIKEQQSNFFEFISKDFDNIISNTKLISTKV